MLTYKLMGIILKVASDRRTIVTWLKKGRETITSPLNSSEERFSFAKSCAQTRPAPRRDDEFTLPVLTPRLRSVCEDLFWRFRFRMACLHLCWRIKQVTKQNGVALYFHSFLIRKEMAKFMHRPCFWVRARVMTGIKPWKNAALPFKRHCSTHSVFRNKKRMTTNGLSRCFIWKPMRLEYCASRLFSFVIWCTAVETTFENATKSLMNIFKKFPLFYLFPRTPNLLFGQLGDPETECLLFFLYKSTDITCNDHQNHPLPP